MFIIMAEVEEDHGTSHSMRNTMLGGFLSLGGGITFSLDITFGRKEEGASFSR